MKEITCIIEPVHYEYKRNGACEWKTHAHTRTHA